MKKFLISITIAVFLFAPMFVDKRACAYERFDTLTNDWRQTDMFLVSATMLGIVALRGLYFGGKAVAKFMLANAPESAFPGC